MALYARPKQIEPGVPFVCLFCLLVLAEVCAHLSLAVETWPLLLDRVVQGTLTAEYCNNLLGHLLGVTWAWCWLRRERNKIVVNASCGAICLPPI